MSRSFIFAVLLFVTACQSRETAKGPIMVNTPTTVSPPSPVVTSKSAFAPDDDYLRFGLMFKAESSQDLDKTNPHKVAAYSIFLCQTGATEKLVRELSPVERDRELGASFMTFVREFCPDLEAFKSTPLHLKFAGYQDGEDTSVWYYYLVRPNGKGFAGDPWVSIHRSKHDGNCSLTGIFLNQPGEERVRMPTGLKFAPEHVINNQ